jgi:hypothetical protein
MPSSIALCWSALKAKIPGIFVSLALAAAVASNGCGPEFHGTLYGENPLYARALEHCRTWPTAGSYERVRLHNANVPCRKAAEMTIELEIAKRLKRAPGDTSPPWSCRELPRSMFPLVWRCARGRHYFTVERRQVR